MFLLNQIDPYLANDMALSQIISIINLIWIHFRLFSFDFEYKIIINGYNRFNYRKKNSNNYLICM